MIGNARASRSGGALVGVLSSAAAGYWLLRITQSREATGLWRAVRTEIDENLALLGDLDHRAPPSLHRGAWERVRSLEMTVSLRGTLAAAYSEISDLNNRIALNDATSVAAGALGTRDTEVIRQADANSRAVNAEMQRTAERTRNLLLAAGLALDRDHRGA